MATIDLTSREIDVVQVELMCSAPKFFFLRGYLPWQLIDEMVTAVTKHKPLGTPPDRFEVVTALLLLLEASED